MYISCIIRMVEKVEVYIFDLDVNIGTVLYKWLQN